MRHLQLQSENSQSTLAHMAAGARKGKGYRMHGKLVVTRKTSTLVSFPLQSSRFARVPLLSAAGEWTIDQLLKTTV